MMKFFYSGMINTVCIMMFPDILGYKIDISSFKL